MTDTVTMLRGSAYGITEALNVWRAVRRDNQVALIAGEPAELRDLIVRDYSRQPVPRCLSSPAGCRASNLVIA